MKKITKAEVKKILGDNATNKQTDIVFTLIDFQLETLKEKISGEIKKLEQKKEESLKKIETDFEKKSEEVFDRTLTKTVQDILKKNGIKIEKVEEENFSESETNVEQELEENLNENDSKNETVSQGFSSQKFYNKY